MNPRIKFKVSKKRDIETFWAFNNEAVFDNGRNLKWAVLDKYQIFYKYKKGHSLSVPKSFVEDLVNNFYFKNKKIINNNLKEYKKNWFTKEGEFFELTKNIFPGIVWPKGKYIAYPTMWGMYPRFLDDKTFQIPYKHKSKKYINVIIAHEMLHFIFYNYLFKKYPKYKLEKFNFLVWQISEIFNSLIQSSPDWISCFGMKSMPYPEHEKIIAKIKKSYKKKVLIVDDLIKSIEKEM